MEQQGYWRVLGGTTWDGGLLSTLALVTVCDCGTSFEFLEECRFAPRAAYKAACKIHEIVPPPPIWAHLTALLCLASPHPSGSTICVLRLLP